MKKARMPRSGSIRIHIAQALLGVALFGLLSMTAVALWSMRQFGVYAICTQTGLGQKAIAVSWTALHDLAKAGITQLAASQAA